MGIRVRRPRGWGERAAGDRRPGPWIVPPRLRTGGEAQERRATWLELFFDLVFVIAIAELSHQLVLDHTAAGFLRFAGSFPCSSRGRASRSTRIGSTPTT